MFSVRSVVKETTSE